MTVIIQNLIKRGLEVTIFGINTRSTYSLPSLLFLFIFSFFSRNFPFSIYKGIKKGNTCIKMWFTNSKGIYKNVKRVKSCINIYSLLPKPIRI